MELGFRSHRLVPRLLGTVVVALLVLFVAPVTPASAHSQIISTNPIDGAVLDTPPTEVRFTFDAPLLDDTDTISINDADGNVVFSAHPKPEGPTVAIPWPAGTKPGAYQVAYRIVCGDGHPEIGALAVTITGAGSSSNGGQSAAPATSPVATPVAAPAATGSALPLAVAAIVIIGAAVAVAVVLMSRRRKPSTTS